MDDPLPTLLAALGCALLGSLFAGADTALSTLTRARLEALLDQTEGSEKKALARIQSNESDLRATYVAGRAACTVLTGILVFQALGVDRLEAHLVVLGLVGTVILLALLYEVSATFARTHADHAAPFAARVLRPFEILLFVVARPLSWLATRVDRPHPESPDDAAVMEAEVEYMVDEGERKGLFGSEPAEMIRNVLELTELTARHVMVPRPKVKAVAIDTPLEEVRKLIVESGHSRYPVFREQRDNIVGLLYAKDVFKASEVKSLDQLLRRSTTFVPESMSLMSLLKSMRSQRQHMFVVVDEFGGSSGIVTLEDVLEEIVGEIQDEHDEAESAPIEDLGDGRLVADADVSIGDLSAYLGADIPEDEEYASLGGLLTHHIGRVPSVGTSVEKFGLRFIVRDSDEKQVAKVEIVRLNADETSDAAAEVA